jgi:hypothetical protein
MSSQSTVRHQTSAGAFATSRRGRLTNEEIHQIEALRARERPMSWQHIAQRFGRCEADLRAAFEPKPERRVEEEPVATRKNLPWNDQQTGYLVASYGKVPCAEIAHVLGCQTSAVIGKAFRLGLSGPRGTNGHTLAKGLFAAPHRAPESIPDEVTPAPRTASVERLRFVA